MQPRFTESLPIEKRDLDCAALIWAISKGKRCNAFKEMQAINAEKPCVVAKMLQYYKQ